MAGSLTRHGSMQMSAVHWLMTTAWCGGLVPFVGEAVRFSNKRRLFAATKAAPSEDASSEARVSALVFAQAQDEPAAVDLAAARANVRDFATNHAAPTETALDEARARTRAWSQAR